MSDYPDHFYRTDANGNRVLKTFDERQADRKRADQNRERIRREVAERAAVPRTEDQRLAAALQERVDTLKHELRFAPPMEKARIQDSLKMYTEKLNAHEAKMAEDARREKFAASDLA